MPDASMGRDVVGARINLDTSKILQSFKVIDTGARGNADSFKVLNGHLAAAEKSYKAMAAAMDKIALTSDQRRAKIMAESNALVQQRTAQAALLTARTQQFDQVNRLTEQKMQAQQAIVQRRQQQIEQQEREHQQRMQILQNRTVTTGQQAARSTGTGSDIAARERVLQEEQKVRRAIEQNIQQTAARQQQAAQNYEKFWINALRTREQKEAATREKVLQEEQRIRNALAQTEQQARQMGSTMDAMSKSWIGRLSDMATHAVVFHTIYRALHEATQAMREGLVDIESNMAGYVQTNEHYFVHFEEGTNHMTMDTNKLNAETQKFIQTAHELGSNIMDVTESARLWGRMYKDVNVVQELVRQSTKLSTVDMVALEDATKSMESVMSQYGVHIHSANDAMVIGNRVLDSWSKVAHDTMAPARDLGAAFQRTGKIAAETGVGFDFMNGLISAGIRNTALSGENLGNMWKTVLGTIRTDKAVNEIERLGVKTKEVVDGVEQWRKAEDILLDLSIQVTDKNYDLTKSYADISRGVYQYAKLAASLNAGDILLGTAASIGSTGSTMQYLTVQMDTISRKAAQTKTSLLEIFNTAGEDGLRQMIKDVLDGIDQLLIGLTRIPTGVFAASAGLAGLFMAYKALSGPIMAVMAATKVLMAAKVADTAATAASTTATGANTAANAVNIVSGNGVVVSTVEQTAARGANAAATTAATAATGALTRAQALATVTTAAATAGLSLLIGAVALYAFKSGDAEKATRERQEALKDQDSASQQIISQYQRQTELLPKLVQAHNSLSKMMESGTLSSSKQVQTKRQLDQISQALAMTLGKEGAAQLEAAGYTEQATKQQLDNLNQLIFKQMEMRKVSITGQKSEFEEQLKENVAQLKNVEEQLAALEGKEVKIFAGRTDASLAEELQMKMESLRTENSKLNSSMADLDVQFSQTSLEALNAQQEMDALSGASGKVADTMEQVAEEVEEQTRALQQSIKDNTSAVAELNQASAMVSKNQSFNAQAAADLIMKYPQLASEIRKTTDGWTFEGDVLEKLRDIKIQKAISDLKAERDTTRDTVLQSLRRIDVYQQEFAAISTFAEARQKLAELEQKQVDEQKRMTDFAKGAAESLVGSGFAPFTVLQNQMQRSMDVQADGLSQVKSVINQYAGELQLSSNQIDAMTKLLNDNTYGVEENDKASKDANKTNKETNEIMTDLMKTIEGNTKSLDKLDSAKKRVAKSSQENLDLLEQERQALLERQTLYEAGYADPSQLVPIKTESTGGGAGGAGTTGLNNLFNTMAGYEDSFKYVYGGKAASSFDQFLKNAVADCSQLVQKTYKEFLGIDVGRTTTDQYAKGQKLNIKTDALQAGDLVFFNTTGRDHSHVGIYKGDGKFFHIGEESGLSTQSMSNSYWSGKYDGAVRFPAVANMSASTASATTSSAASYSGSAGGYTGKYQDTINGAAAKYGVDPFLIAAVIQQESSFGANGITNVMQVNGKNNATVAESISAGTKMLADLLDKAGGDWKMALGGYNMGEGIIDWFKETGGYNKADMIAYSQKYGKGKRYGTVSYVDDIAAKYSPQTVTTKAPTQKELADAQKGADAELLQISDKLYDVDVQKLEAKLGMKDMDIADKELLLKQSEQRQEGMRKDSAEYKAELDRQIKLKTEIQKIYQEQRQLIDKSGLKSDELINKRRSLTEKIGDIQSDKGGMQEQYASDQWEASVASMEAKVERMRQQGRGEAERVKEQLRFYQDQLKNTSLTEEQRAEATKQVYDLTQRSTEIQFQTSNEFIDNQAKKMERQGKSEATILQMQVSAYDRMRKSQTLTAEQRAESDEKYYEASKKLGEAQFEHSNEWIDKQSERMQRQGKSEAEILQMQAEGYNRLRKNKALTADQRAESEKKYQDTAKNLTEARYDHSENWIAKEAVRMEMVGKDKVSVLKMELNAYLRMQADKTRSAAQQWELEQNIYKSREELDKEYYSAAEKRINHAKAMGQLTTAQELVEYQKLQAAYLDGSDERMSADEKVYDLKKRLTEEATKAVTEAAAKQKKALDAARDAEIKSIQAEKDAFTAAQEAKIKALDDVLQAMERNNDEADYERQRAEKVARLQLLQSAVSPEGIAERKQVEKEIEDMDRDHGRKLARQAIEDQKTALQTEKETQEKGFDDKMQAAKDHYESLTTAYDEFSSATELSAENLKTIQVLKEAEKNATIIAQLDQFVVDYQARMDQIAAAQTLAADVDVSGVPLAPGTASKQQSDTKALDLYTYNANKEAWDLAKARGDAAAMKTLAAQNEALRKKYGLGKDTGKIQQFSEGGVVQGMRGAAVPVIAHAGEIFLNDPQQQNLMKLLNMSLPKIDFSMPSFTPATTNNNTTSIDNRVYLNRGDTILQDQADVTAYWTEEENFMRRQSVRGRKG
ncbi:NlpC/P60 family protein [Saccharibacillus brassicae]|uniref:NlpC/P60 domain-containing protein n=1 Tax=Saccharibacillus brassicae TaxID=2583377 RepID=A0A4Y6V0C9_SACBS|nr:NlpC/P60 family protein [Saccharibacillus brassicae]QDH23453.1 hypothetical protein FFV09_22850 [Saccharibacillus brassicae]